MSTVLGKTSHLTILILISLSTWSLLHSQYTHSWYLNHYVILFCCNISSMETSKQFSAKKMFPSIWSQGMMIDEADEFVTGPQNKKRGNATEPNSGAAPKRRRSMSPLLRRPQTPPIISNHVLGKGTTVVPGQHGLIKPIPLHKGEHFKALRSGWIYSIHCLAIDFQLNQPVFVDSCKADQCFSERLACKQYLSKLNCM